MTFIDPGIVSDSIEILDAEVTGVPPDYSDQRAIVGTIPSDHTANHTFKHLLLTYKSKF